MSNSFGGKWTEQKLDILKNYLDFYCTALKNTKFKKIYIDCFAGSGEIVFKSGISISGSARLALEVENKFDEYYFIEFDKKNAKELEKLKVEYPNQKIYIINSDCNVVLPQILDSIDWKYSRGVLFIDPYATQFKYSNLQLVADTKAIDVWYLFPFSAINRLLTKTGDMDITWEKRLIECLGTDDWKESLYKDNPQMNLFGEQELVKDRKESIYDYIYNRMNLIFPYVSPKYMALKNSNNSTMFLLFLLISNDNKKAVGLVKKVEKYILKG